MSEVGSNQFDTAIAGWRPPWFISMEATNSVKPQLVDGQCNVMSEAIVGLSEKPANCQKPPCLMSAATTVSVSQAREDREKIFII